MFDLRISKQAEKQIKLLKKEYQLEIIEALSEIKEDPLSGKPLDRDLTGRFSFSYRLRVYSIIYKVDQKDKVVEILSAGHRGRVYN